MKNSVLTRTLLLLLLCIVVSFNAKAQTLAEKIANREQLTNLATVYLTVPEAEGKDINSVLYKTGNVAEYHAATIQVVDNGTDGTGIKLENFIDNKLEIKVRGNSTAMDSKRPYRLKFGKDKTDAAGNVIETHKHDMLGLGYKKRNWTLLTNHKDPSLLRNAITYHIGQAVGMPFCPGYKFVDLVINNEYRGNYMLSDHVEVGNHRVDVDDDTGWFVEAARGDMVEEPLVEAAGLRISIKNPEPTTDAETASLKSEVAAYFNKLNYYWGIYSTPCSDEAFRDPINGWRQYIDEESLVRFYLGINLTDDYDGFMTVKMYREVDGKLQFGPLWDKDLAYGNWQNHGKFCEEYQTGYTFCDHIQRMMTDPVFVKRVHDKLHEVIENGYTQTVTAKVEELGNMLTESQKLNQNKWWTCDNYPVAVNELSEYIKDRVDFLIEKIDAKYEAMGGDNIQEPTPNLGGEGGDDTEHTCPYEVTIGEWQNVPLPASAIHPRATAFKIKVVGASFFRLLNSNDENDYISQYSFDYNGANMSGREFDVTDETTLNKAKAGTLYLRAGGGTNITVTITCTIPEEPTCTDHIYNEGHYVSNGNGTYSLACDKCGEKQPNSPAYYKYTVYAESSTAETVYNTSKAWRPENGKPNTLLYVEDAAGIDGRNVVQTTAATCSDFVLTDGHPFYNPAKFAADKVSYTRNMNASTQWGTVCLPFKIVSGDDVTVYHLTDSNTDGNGNGTMVFTEATSGTGGLTPLIYKKNHKDATTVSFTGGEQKDHTFTVKAHKAYTENTSLTVPTNWAMYGNVLEPVTISTSTTTNPAVYYIAGDKFWHATGNLAINPFRAYFEYSYATGAKPATFSISEDNEETGLNSIIDEKRTLAVFLREGGISVVAPKNMDVTIYSANGSAVSHIKAEANNEYDVNLPKGVYVVNGVKFVVK